MKRRIQGLHEADHTAAGRISDDLLLVYIEKAQHRWESRKRFYLLRFLVLELRDVRPLCVVAQSQTRHT